MNVSMSDLITIATIIYGSVSNLNNKYTSSPVLSTKKNRHAIGNISYYNTFLLWVYLWFFPAIIWIDRDFAFIGAPLLVVSSIRNAI